MRQAAELGKTAVLLAPYPGLRRGLRREPPLAALPAPRSASGSAEVLDHRQTAPAGALLLSWLGGLLRAHFPHCS